MCNPNSSVALRRTNRFQQQALQQAQATQDVNVQKKLSQPSPSLMSLLRLKQTAAAAADAYKTTSLEHESFSAATFFETATAASTTTTIPPSTPKLSTPPAPSLVTAALAAAQEEPIHPCVKPKRRRKPQQPGKTAKHNDRHFVVHNYHDHANDTEADLVLPEGHDKKKGGVTVSFPLKLHAVLDQIEADGLAHVISWQPHGRAFVIHKPKTFVEHVMPLYFKQTKLTSFQRQLNLYGWQRLTKGPDATGYYHELFLRNKPFLCQAMVRTKVKGTRYKAASSPEQEPNFYAMEPVGKVPTTSSTTSTVSMVVSDDSSSSHHSSETEEDTPMGNTSTTATAPAPSVVAPASYVAPEDVYPGFSQPIRRSAPILPSANGNSVVDQAITDIFWNDTDAAAVAIAGATDPASSDELEQAALDFCGQLWEDVESDPLLQMAVEGNNNLENDGELGDMLDKLLEEW